MAITSVRAKFNGTWVTLSYNSSTKMYEGTITPQSPATYYIDLEAANSSGKVTTVAGSSLPALKLVVQDTVYPVLTVSSPANGLVTAASSVTVSGTAADNVGISSLTVNGVSVTVGSNGAFSRSVSLSAGQNTITVIATDTAGNKTTVTRTVTRATAGPALNITSPSNGSVIRTSSVTVTGTVSDSVSPVASVTVNGVAATISNGTFTAAVPLSEGANTLTAVAKNQVNLSTSKSVSVTRDMTAPVLNVTSPVNGLVTVAASVTVSGTVSDAVAVSQVKVNGTAVTVNNGAFSTTVNLSAGVNTITVTATDTAGNSSAVTRTVSRATEGPKTAITSPSDGFLTNQNTITVTGTVSDSVSPVASVTVNGTAVPVNNGTFTAAVSLSEGANTITVIAQNQVGLSTTKTVSGTKDSIAPSIALTAPTAGQIVSNASFTVTGTVSDDRSGISGVTVNGAAASVSGSMFSRTLTLAEGTNAITAIASDNAGNTATASGTVILDTIPPVLTVTYPAGDIYTNQPQITVTGTAKDVNLDYVTVNGMMADRSGESYSRTLNLTEGVNTITVSAYDKAGHVTTVTRRVHLDTAPPVLTLVSPSEGWLTVNRPTVVFSASDETGGSGVNWSTAQISLDGVKQTNGVTVSGNRISFTPPATLPDGQHVVTATIKDRAGNQRGLSASYGVDTLPPELKLSLPDSHVVVDTENIIVAGFVFDAGSGVESVTVGGKRALVSADGKFEYYAPLEIGMNEITVAVKDHAALMVSKSFTAIRLVTDRVQEDLEKLQRLFAIGLDNWTAAEKTWFASTLCHRGCYDVLDVNRVELAVDWIGDWLHGYGYFVDWGPPVEWNSDDALTDSDAARYLVRVQTLRGALTVPDGTPETPNAMRNVLTLQGANDIEKILVAVDSLRPLLEQSWWYCGEIGCGEV